MSKLSFLFIAVLILLIADLALGSIVIPFVEVLKILTGQLVEKSTWTTIVLDFRLPRALTAILAGAALSISGLLMQTFFRNPIAGPYVLGVSSGASLGVAILILAAGFIPFDPVNQWTMALFASSGAALVMLLVLSVAWKVKDVATLLIVGLMFGSATSAIVTILQYFSGAAALKQFVMWSFGSLAGVTWTELYLLLPLIVVVLAWAITLSKPLNALLLGEQYAQSMGVNLKKVRWQIIFVTAILAGSITAFCGPIGFIGIAVPHIARMIFGTQQHRILMPASILVGVVIMLMCDIIAQMPGSELNLPINAITSMIGAPVVIWIVLKN